MIEAIIYTIFAIFAVYGLYSAAKEAVRLICRGKAEEEWCDDSEGVAAEEDSEADGDDSGDDFFRT